MATIHGVGTGREGHHDEPRPSSNAPGAVDSVLRGGSRILNGQMLDIFQSPKIITCLLVPSCLPARLPACLLACL